MTHRAIVAQPIFWIVAGALPLAAAFWAEHVAGLAPCLLCLAERWPYRVMVLLGVAWTACRVARINAVRLFAILIGLTLLTSIGIGVLHVGIEQAWWPDPFPACTAPRFHAGTFAERLASMPARPAKPCDTPNRLFAWLPVSMASLDVLYATVLLFACPWRSRSNRRSR